MSIDTRAARNVLTVVSRLASEISLRERTARRKFAVITETRFLLYQVPNFVVAPNANAVGAKVIGDMSLSIFFLPLSLLLDTTNARYR